MTKRLLFLAFFATSTVFAAPTITSVTPNSGPVTGGTHVIIKGTGFSNNCIICSPPFGAPSIEFRVLTVCCEFNVVPASAVTFIDSTTIEILTPPHMPGTYTISVRNLDNSGLVLAPNAFTYTGDPNDAFEPLLFPVFTRGVAGLFGSFFFSSARVFPKGSEPLRLYGEDTLCDTSASPFRPGYGPRQPQLITSDTELRPVCSTATGRILWTLKGTAGSLAANIRVADAIHDSRSHGAEIPVVRQSGFSTGKIALLGVPTDPRFRVRLRIYSLAQTSDPVNIEGFDRQVFLTPGRDIFDPSYAEVSDLPPNLTRVIISPGSVPLWAFITVTNNDTQQITTITPN